MKRRSILLAAAFLLGLIIYRKWHAMISIAAVSVYTAVFSLLLAPVCTRMEHHGIRQSHAAAYAVVGLFLMVVLLFAALIPYLAVRAADLFKRISPLAIDIVRDMAVWTESLAGTKALFGESDGLIGMTLSSAAGILFRIGRTAASQIGRIGFSLILTYYVLCDRTNISGHLLLVVPYPWRRGILALLSASRNAMMSYFSGLMKTSAFVAAATGLGLVALGVQDAIVLALLMGVFEILPYVGPILASIPILLSALMQGGDTLIFTLVMIVGIQQIEGGFISPYFTAASTSVHPLAAVFSVFAAGSLWGFWGILLAIPSLVLLQSVLGSAVQLRDEIKNTEWIC